jgi:hypothetical protein
MTKDHPTYDTSDLDFTTEKLVHIESITSNDALAEQQRLTDELNAARVARERKRAADLARTGKSEQP